MVGLFSPHLSSLGWPLEDPISQQHEDLNQNKNLETNSDSIDLHSPNSACEKNGASFNNDGKNMVEKLNHNARERDRRKRINDLYSTLRSLLPHEDQYKKLSIPITVSKVVDYIPVLQQQVERLAEKKKTLLAMASSSSDMNSDKVEEKCCSVSSVVVFATPISDREVVFHMSMPKSGKKRAVISRAIEILEREGYIAMNASCFESFDGRVFYNLHLQPQGSRSQMDVEMLKKKVCSIM